MSRPDWEEAYAYQQKLLDELKAQEPQPDEPAWDVEVSRRATFRQSARFSVTAADELQAGRRAMELALRPGQNAEWETFDAPTVSLYNLEEVLPG